MRSMVKEQDKRSAARMQTIGKHRFVRGDTALLCGPPPTSGGPPPPRRGGGWRCADGIKAKQASAAQSAKQNEAALSPHSLQYTASSPGCAAKGGEWCPLTSFMSAASGPAAFDLAQVAAAAQAQPKAHDIGARQVDAALMVGAQRAHIAQAGMRMKNPVEKAGARLRVRADGIAALSVEGGHGVLRGFFVETRDLELTQ